MTGGFPLDLILFAMVAAFLVLRAAERARPPDGVRAPAGPGTARPRLRPARRADAGRGGRGGAPAPPKGGARHVLPDPRTVPGAALGRIAAAERGFDPENFLNGAEGAFRMIVTAFAAGDRQTLRALLSDATYAGFEQAITAREKAGEQQRTEIRAVHEMADRDGRPARQHRRDRGPLRHRPGQHDHRPGWRGGDRQRCDHRADRPLDLPAGDRLQRPELEADRHQPRLTRAADMERRRPRWRRLLHAWMLLLAGGAAAQEMAALPGWAEEDAAAALPPFLASCRELARRDPAESLGGAGEAAARGGRPADWARACAEAALVPPGGERDFLERRFRPLPATPGLLTGYYEPELSGRLAPDAAHPAPLRGLPPDGTPMPDRAAIEAGALAGLAPHLAYADPVEAFFLQIQGSGRLLLPDGGLLRLGHAGQNGHPYRAIGRLLIERGAVAREAMSMQAIRAWLAAAPPAEAAALLRENPSYIFFRRMEDLRPDQGPPGTLGVPLTPGRSLAVDAAFRCRSARRSGW